MPKRRDAKSPPEQGRPPSRSLPIRLPGRRDHSRRGAIQTCWQLRHAHHIRRWLCKVKADDSGAATAWALHVFPYVV